MKKISLLDCTLRDGGYVNDWRFGQDHLVSIFERLAASGVDIIEIGFLDERRPFDIDRSIMPDTKSAEKIYGGLERGQAMVVAMIDYGTCGIENLQPCAESFLDGIRVIFKKGLMRQAMEYCRAVKKLGYKVFAQLVSITSYSDEELSELIALVNDVAPYAVSMVDTYGLLHPEELLHYYGILDRDVRPGIQIGFHAHNNFQLGYANAVALLERDARHAVIVDGTLYGMGKSAGNAPLELLAMRLNTAYGKEYQIGAMITAIEESILGFFAKAPWGYQMFYYLCGKNKCHPNYLTYFKGKQNYSLEKIDRMLGEISPEEKKLLYDAEVAEAVYQRFMRGAGSDEKDRLAFVRETANKKLLIVGPGKNICLQKEKIDRFIERENPYIMAVNYIPDHIKPDCVFVTNPMRYHDMVLRLEEEACGEIKFLATANVECIKGKFDFTIQRAPLLEANERIADNSFLMLLRFLRSISTPGVFCAGFDGYSEEEDNYFNPAMEYGFVKREALHLNLHVKEMIAEFRKEMDIRFITYSAYDAVEDINGASI